MDRADWAPSPADVGSVIRARTKDDLGSEIGTFNENTRPTALEVMDEVDLIVSEINAICGLIPDPIQDNARRTAAVGAAAQIELSYWPEQVGNNRSPYDRLYARYIDMRTMLKQQVADFNDDGSSTNNDNPLPVFGFPDTLDSQAFVGWQTDL